MPGAPSAWTDRWLGCVVPKRQARRAVTRNMIKRQVRAAMQRHENALPPGMWLVRLRQGFAPAEYRSADSARLRLTVRSELDHLFDRVARGPSYAASSRGGAMSTTGDAGHHRTADAATVSMANGRESP